MGETMREAFARAAEELRVARLNVKCDECGEVGCNRASCAMLASGMPRMLCGAYSWEPDEHLSRCRECRLQRARARNLVQRLSLLVDAVMSDAAIRRRIAKSSLRYRYRHACSDARAQADRLLDRATRIEAKYLQEGT